MLTSDRADTIASLTMQECLYNISLCTTMTTGAPPKNPACAAFIMCLLFICVDHFNKVLLNRIHYRVTPVSYAENLT
jgi:hypothetical protein